MTDDLVIRDARTADVPGLVRAWRDAGRFAVETDASAFRVPVEDGLEAYFVASLETMGDDETVLVAERDGEVVGFVSARVLDPETDARWQIQRESRLGYVRRGLTLRKGALALSSAQVC